MKDLKIDLIDILHNEDEKQEAVWMLNKIGYKTGYKSVNFYRYLYACGSGDYQYSKTIQFGNNAKTFRKSNFKETTLAELRGMVKPVQEYLNTETYEYKQAHTKPDGEWVCIPDGAEQATLCGTFIAFWKDGAAIFIGDDTDWDYDYNLDCQEYLKITKDCGSKIIWQRPQQPEALPFIDDNPQSLNDQYAEIEQVRQAVKVKSGSDSDHIADAMSYGFMGIKQDNVNHPTHYTQGKVECIDALESATIGKSGIEAVCVANIIKYLWRYEEKNGLEDIKKANFYLNRLIATLENNNG